MRAAIRLCLLLWAVLSAAAMLAGQTSLPIAPDVNDRGTFEIYSAGANIGSETFDIHTAGERIEASSTSHLQGSQNGKKFDVQTSSALTLDSYLDPLSYTWTQKGTPSSQLSVEFRPKAAHATYKQVNGQSDRRDFKLDKDVVVLDDNIIHHYQLALARYDQSKGGVQALRGFIPQEAMPGVITLQFLGSGPVNVKGNSLVLRHFVLTSDNAQISLWTDDQGRLQVVSSADNQFQAVRDHPPAK